MKLSVILFALIFLTGSCSANVRYTKAGKTDSLKQKYYNGQVLEGYSSYYGKKFHGRKTANGEIFDMYKLSAAHRYLPFGTILEVTNLTTKRSARVRVNDRGPFVGNRILDLSYGAARKIGLISSGVAKVKIRIIQLGQNKK